MTNLEMVLETILDFILWFVLGSMLSLTTTYDFWRVGISCFALYLMFKVVFIFCAKSWKALWP